MSAEFSRVINGSTKYFYYACFSLEIYLKHYCVSRENIDENADILYLDPLNKTEELSLGKTLTQNKTNGSAKKGKTKKEVGFPKRKSRRTCNSCSMFMWYRPEII